METKQNGTQMISKWKKKANVPVEQDRRRQSSSTRKAWIQVEEIIKRFAFFKLLIFAEIKMFIASGTQPARKSIVPSYVSWTLPFSLLWKELPLMNLNMIPHFLYILSISAKIIFICIRVFSVSLTGLRQILCLSELLPLGFA